ncbi:9129_t:CDS:1 [Acaulospora morrowiae]|uniref:9129_t:CDS:1 n=1 Tax=Acaulospora morrowiae TaxID=94023 RepID=A0A9N9B3C4_9GLOM|nr:9129_t:CDS:1 [Acaulospora morrowiae]
MELETHIISTRRQSYKRSRTTSRLGGPASTPINSVYLPVAMRIPQEILCNIFNYLVDHPVHYTRVARVCKSWQLAADSHLYWRHLVTKLNLIPPKPRARKYKTYKQVVERDWNSFCSLCFRGRHNGFERLNIRSMETNLSTIAEIYRNTKTNWFHIFDEDGTDFQVSFKTELSGSEIFKAIKSDSDNSKPSASAAIANQQDSHHIVNSLVTTEPDRSSFAISSQRSAPASYNHKRNSVHHQLCKLCNMRIFNTGLSKSERYSLLTSMLSDYGYIFPNNSRSCLEYVECGMGNPTAVVRTFVELSWYYKYTNYKSLRVIEENPPEESGDEDDDMRDMRYILRFDRNDDYYDHDGISIRDLATYISPYRIDVDRGKKLALKEWVNKRLKKGITKLPRDDPETQERPPKTLWVEIDNIIIEQLNSSDDNRNEEFEAESSRMAQY